MQKGLVSLLTPCYNTGHLIHRLLDSVLAQTYPYIEMFVIDDGSTDNSEQIIKKYIPRFEEKGYSLSYHYQENSGQSVAIKNGLQLINGEFLAWPDSDDFYASSEAINKMVATLNSSSDKYAVVRVFQRVVKEDSLKELFIVGNSVLIEKHDLFEDCLLDTENFYWGAGAYMVRTKTLQQTTKYNIYTEKDAGQNWQLFLPIFYSYGCLTLKEVLYTVISRNVSHSRKGNDGYLNKIKRIDIYERTVLATLNRILNMNEIDRIKYIDKVKEKFLQDRMRIAFIYRQRKDYQCWYKTLSRENRYKNKELILYVLVKLHIEFFLSFFRKIRNIFI